MGNRFRLKPVVISPGTKPTPELSEVPPVVDWVVAGVMDFK
jgi:hypothetical protein